MDAELAVNQILDDEGLTSDLDEAEATVLVKWLVNDVHKIAKDAKSDEAGWKLINAQRQLARKIARSVALFRDEGNIQASQYATQQQLPWPVPPPTEVKVLLEYLLHSAK